MSVILFFIFNVLATAALGSKFISKGEGRVFRIFGIALVLNAVAFAVWSFGLIRQTSLLVSVTVGTVIFLISLAFMFYTSIQKVESVNVRRSLMASVTLVLLGIFYIGHLDPVYAYISPEGYLIFNLSPLIQLLYVFILALFALPAVNLVASQFRLTSYSIIFHYSLIAQICGGIMLLTSKDSQVLYVTGLIIGVVYLLLLTVFIFNPKPWSNIS